MHLRSKHPSSLSSRREVAASGPNPVPVLLRPRRQLPKLAAAAPSSSDSSTRVASASLKSKSNNKSKSPVKEDDYNAQQIQVLEGLEPVRKRPGMYIGSTGTRGLHHLVYEVLDNAIDEVQGGHADRIAVDMDIGSGPISCHSRIPQVQGGHADRIAVDMDIGSGWVTITDNGRGIPTDLHPRTGKSALETVLTVLHAGGKFGGDDSGYKVSGGLHGVGVSVVNALSESLEIKVWRNGRQYAQTYSRGLPLSDLEETELPPNVAHLSSTQVRFNYDRDIFSPTAHFDPDTIRSRLRELAFLNSAATILASKNGQTLHTPLSALNNGNGKAEVAPLASTSSASNGHAVASTRDPSAFSFEAAMTIDRVEVEISLQWCSDAFSDTLIGFANSIRTVDGGTHMEGLRAALTRVVNNLARTQKLTKEGDPALIGDHIREGLGGVISVKVPDPEFEGQTKTRLGNPEVRKIVESAVTQAVGEWLESHPKALSEIVAKATLAAKAADAAKRARELANLQTAQAKTERRQRSS
eukprot:gene11062-18669_t